jgi:hypothetical protein
MLYAAPLVPDTEVTMATAEVASSRTFPHRRPELDFLDQARRLDHRRRKCGGRSGSELTWLA